jgi:phospholipid transport system transporter-binding protein
MPSAIQVNTSGECIISGDLNFENVPALFRRGAELINASPKPVFDFRHVANCDNAALALLISWVKYAKKAKKPIKLHSLPKQLLDLAKISGLIGILPIS